MILITTIIIRCLFDISRIVQKSEYIEKITKLDDYRSLIEILFGMVDENLQ